MGKVLVVDDEQSLRELIKTYLEYSKLTVDTASDGVEALEMLENENYDVVLSDIQMPRMNGLALAEEVRRIQPDTSMILMTGYASVNSAVEAIKISVFDYILKPFQNMQILFQTVNRGIERKHLIQEHRILTENLKRTNEELAYHRQLLQKKVAEIDSELTNQLKRLTTLYEISRSAKTISNLEKLMLEILDKITVSIPGSSGIFWLYDKETETISRDVSVGIINKEKFPVRIKIDSGDFQEAFNFRNVVINKDVKDISDVNFKKACVGENISSLIIVPLCFEDEVLGSVSVHFKNNYNIANEDINLLSAVADQVSVSIKNAELYSNQQKLFRETIEALATAIDSRDHYTGGHSYMVTQYSLLIAKKLGFGDDRLELIRIAGLLHDVGKIGISDTILNKPEKLTDEEMSVIKSHPILGRIILESIDSLKPAAKLIYHHHERYDGKGYPEGVAADRIPLESRILQIADVFHALTSDRIYRKAMSLEKALSIIRDELGTTFDPEIGGVFLELTKEDAFKVLFQTF